MEASFRPVSFLFLFLSFLFLPNFFFCTGLLSELRCIDTERQALLKFKQLLTDPSNRLSSWTVDGDCCQWVGVVCHNLTAHVHQLHLRSFPPVRDDSMSQEQYVAEYEAYWRSTFGGPNNENKGSKHNGELEVDWFFVSLALGFVVGFWGVCGPLLLNKKWRIMYFQFLDHTSFLYNTLQFKPMQRSSNLT